MIWATVSSRCWIIFWNLCVSMLLFMFSNDLAIESKCDCGRGLYFFPFYLPSLLYCFQEIIWVTAEEEVLWTCVGAPQWPCRRDTAWSCVGMWQWTQNDKKNTYLCKDLLSGSKNIKTMVSIMGAEERKEDVLASGVIVREDFSERAAVEQILEEWAMRVSGKSSLDEKSSSWKVLSHRLSEGGRGVQGDWTHVSSWDWGAETDKDSPGVHYEDFWLLLWGACGASPQCWPKEFLEVCWLWTAH